MTEIGPSLIEAKGITKEFRKGESVVHALRGIDMRLAESEFLAVMGPSGSGKSTLLHILGCLERPTSGDYMLGGLNVLEASDEELSHIRASRIGFVFQTFNLVPHLDVYENVELPFLYSSFDDQEIKQRVLEAIKRVGLNERLKHRPAELSGGEMQRTAIARAIAIKPAIILADEPTGNLDSNTGLEILTLFQKLHEDGATIAMITHDRTVASFAQKTTLFKDGKCVDTI